MFHLIVIISAKAPADVDPIAGALARMRPLCLAEPGCVRWEAYHSQEDPGRFVLVEHWESRELWEAHGELTALPTVFRSYSWIGEIRSPTCYCFEPISLCRKVFLIPVHQAADLFVLINFSTVVTFQRKQKQPMLLKMG